jgi:tripeptidyl-peptidase-1
LPFQKKELRIISVIKVSTAYMGVIAATVAAVTLLSAVPDERTAFSLILARQHPHALAAAVSAVSQPESKRFRKYLAEAEIAALLQPTGLKTVESWIRGTAPAASVERQAHGSGQVLRVTATAAEVAALFGDSVNKPPLLPPSVAPHVDTVLGLYERPHPPTTRPMLSRRRTLVESGAKCDFKGDVIDPNVLAKQYGWPVATMGSGKMSQGVAAFEDAQFRPSDVAAFEVAYSLPNVTFSVKGPNKGGFFGEASLDTQYIAASGAGIPSWFLSQEAFDLASWCEMVLAVKPLPTVWSVSWGGGESNYPPAAQRAADDCFARAALKGVTVLAASGDEGTGSHGSVFGCKAFDPTYPASCIHVTSVGATYLENGGETGWRYSGGGYSNIFARPAWQQAAVSSYEANATLPPSSLYNTSGRVTPDVSALGTCYEVFSGGGPIGTLSGTSAATPTFAGMVSRINDARVAAGKPTVGFINPLLYQAGSVGTDIVAGNNKKAGCKAGFPAVAGFDAVTGLGTPLWDRLSAVLNVDTLGCMHDPCVTAPPS